MIIYNLGIFPESIDKAWEECCEVMELVRRECRLDELQASLEEQVSDYFSWDNPTNSIIEAMFELTKEQIRFVYPDLEVSYDIDGYCSELHVGKEYLFSLFSSEADISDELVAKAINYLSDGFFTDEDIVELCLAGEETVDDLIASMQDNELVFYESVEELGEDNSENGCREEDDTDESFGRFLIQSYKDGNSNTFYFEFEDGRVVAVPLSKAENVVTKTVVERSENAEGRPAVVTVRTSVGTELPFPSISKEDFFLYLDERSSYNLQVENALAKVCYCDAYEIENILFVPSSYVTEREQAITELETLCGEPLANIFCCGTLATLESIKRDIAWRVNQ